MKGEDKEGISWERVKTYNKIFYNKSWVQREYNSLSAEAKELLNKQINRLFWIYNPHMNGKKLDPNNPKHNPYIEEWEQIKATNLMKGKKYWEKSVSEGTEQKI